MFQLKNFRKITSCRVKSRLDHLLALWPQASHLASLSLDSLPCGSEIVFTPNRTAVLKMGVTSVGEGMGKLGPWSPAAGSNVTWCGPSKNCVELQKVRESFQGTHMGSLMVCESPCGKKGNSIPIFRVLRRVTRRVACVLGTCESVLMGHCEGLTRGRPRKAARWAAGRDLPKGGFSCWGSAS